MSTADIPGVGCLPVLLAYHINLLCDRHEAAWLAGRRPRIEDVLTLEAEPGRTVLLRELLAAELAARSQRGEVPDGREYRHRFPNDTGLIDAVFAEAEAPRAVGGNPDLAGVDRGPEGCETVDIPSHDDPTRPGGGPAGTGDPSAPSHAAGGPGGRYRILRRHLRGGLGEVFVAFDEELRREVALKAIRPEHAGQARSQARFLLEAEITGRLEHPGIVPIYGLDRHADGRPYYAMRFVQGHTLKEAIAQFHGADGPRRDAGKRTLALRQLLRRFIDVCNALAYAHSRGVLHRDLKPANILLGPFGETLIVDWGLAKAIDLPDEGGGPSASAVRPTLAGDSTLTQTGSALGTPGFMSPEQAAGRWERLGPPSDVYSLGATLYCILTGRAPIDARDIDEALRRTRDGDFPPPRQVQREVDTALEAICLKAMALDPEDRYSSALALAEDLEHWLADEPVSARREALSQRARRWGRRHRTAVSAAAVAVLAGVIGLAAVAAVQARSNVALSGAKEATEKALAETQQEKAKAEEALAQSEAVRAFLVEAFRSPDPDQDGREIKVAEVLERASRRLDQEFRGSQATRGALLDALARTYMGLGLPDEAVRLIERAGAEREEALGRDHPETLKTRILSISLFAEYAGRPADAVALGEATWPVTELKLGPDHPNTFHCRHNLAVAYLAAGRTDEAVDLFERTLRLQESKLGPDHLDTLSSRLGLANAYLVAGRADEAVTLLEGALRMWESKQGPDHPDTLKCSNSLGAAYLAAGRTDEAIALFEGTLRRQESKLGPDHPHLLDSRNNLANACFDAGRMSEALVLYKATLKRMELKLGPDHPHTLGVRNNLATAYYDTGRKFEAIAMFAVTLKLMESKLGPDHPETLISRHNLAEAYLNAGRTSEAVAMFAATLAQRKSKLGPDHPDTLESRIGLAAAYESLGRWSDAELLRRDALARRRKTVKPDSPVLAGDLAGFGYNLLKQERWSEAEPLLREELAICEKAIPDDWRMFVAMNLLGEALRGQGRHADAEPLVVAGYEGTKARATRVPATRQYHVYESAEHVVRLYEAWGRPDQATAWKAKLGLSDLPADVFAPARGR